MDFKDIVFKYDGDVDLQRINAAIQNPETGEIIIGCIQYVSFSNKKEINLLKILSPYFMTVPSLDDSDTLCCLMVKDLQKYYDKITTSFDPKIWIDKIMRECSFVKNEDGSWEWTSTE